MDSMVLGSWLGSISALLWERLSLREWIFLSTTMIALLVDPMFLYIPMVDESNKCIRMDKKLRIACLVLRSLGDTTFILLFIHQIREAIKAGGKLKLDLEKQRRRAVDDVTVVPKLWPSIIIYFLVLLPIPQVLILVAFFKTRGSGYLDKGAILNILLFVQYLPRIYQTRQLSTKIATTGGYLAKIVFYFFLYIVICHVVGAFWYFFSIQREMVCWHHAFVNHNASRSSVYCDDSSSKTRNITLLNEFCPIISPDPSVFDFGIFLESLQSNNKGSITFPRKLWFSLWWAMRNLSNFGQNLVTSNFVFENCFAILISVSLPIYALIGYYVQMEQKRSKGEEVEEWMSKNDLPSDFQKEIILIIRRGRLEHMDVDVENICRVLPWRTQRSLKDVLCKDMLGRLAPRLQGINADPADFSWLMRDYLRPVMYRENSFVIRRGEPLDFILLITGGMIWVYSGSDDGSSSISRILTKGDTYGDEQLRSWASSQNSNDPYSTLRSVPISKENVKCHAHSKVEGFILSAQDLREIIRLPQRRL